MTELQRIDYFSPGHRTILLAEDNEGDLELFKELCESANVSHSLFVARDGEAVLEFLRAHRPLPDIVILDINMPKLNGHGVLEAMHADETLSKVPVIVLTSSEASRDVQLAQEGGACGYIVKSPDFRISELLSVIDAFHATPGMFIKVGDT